MLATHAVTSGEPGIGLSRLPKVMGVRAPPTGSRTSTSAKSPAAHGAVRDREVPPCP